MDTTVRLHLPTSQHHRRSPPLSPDQTATRSSQASVSFVSPPTTSGSPALSTRASPQHPTCAGVVLVPTSTMTAALLSSGPPRDSVTSVLSLALGSLFRPARVHPVRPSGLSRGLLPAGSRLRRRALAPTELRQDALPSPTRPEDARWATDLHHHGDTMSKDCSHQAQPPLRPSRP